MINHFEKWWLLYLLLAVGLYNLKEHWGNSNPSHVPIPQPSTPTIAPEPPNVDGSTPETDDHFNSVIQEYNNAVDNEENAREEERKCFDRSTGTSAMTCHDYTSDTYHIQILYDMGEISAQLQIMTNNVFGNPKNCPLGAEYFRAAYEDAYIPPGSSSPIGGNSRSSIRDFCQQYGYNLNFGRSPKRVQRIN